MTYNDIDYVFHHDAAQKSMAASNTDQDRLRSTVGTDCSRRLSERGCCLFEYDDQPRDRSDVASAVRSVDRRR